MTAKPGPRIERGDCPHCDEYIYYTRGEWNPSLTLLAFRQKSRTIYLGYAPASVIDALTDVPEIPENLDYDMLARWMLGNVTAWQRPLDSDRVENIGVFWSSDQNFLVNPSVLGVNPDLADAIMQVEKIEGDGPPLVRITFKNWYVDECPDGHADAEGRFFDKCPDHNCARYHHGLPDSKRPLQIIDGQHRIRGSQGGPSSREIDPSTGEPYGLGNLPLVLLRSDEMDSFDLQSQAKIFTEITTKGEELYPNHKIFLMYRFAQSGVVPGFGSVDMRPGTAEHKTYETCLRIDGPEFGNTRANPFRKRIPPIRGRPGQSRVASLDFLFEKIRPLFGAGKPFNGMLPYEAAQIVVAFGQAMVLSWDRISPQGRYYWYPPNTPNAAVTERSGIISTGSGGENSTWLRILFSLLEDVIKKTGARNPNRQQLIDAMKPIAASDFEGQGWSSIPGQEAREDYMASLLRDVLVDPRGGFVAREMRANGLVTLNDYVAQPPLLSDIEVSNPLGPVAPGSPPNIGPDTTLTFKVPFNSMQGMRILYTQAGLVREDVVDHPIRGGVWKVQLQPNTHYRPTSGEVLDVTVIHRNPVSEGKRSARLGVP